MERDSRPPTARLPLVMPDDYWVTERPDCYQELDVDQIVPNAEGPVLDGDHVAVQPVRVPTADGGSVLAWELVAGERIWRAAREAGIRELHAEVRLGGLASANRSTPPQDTSPKT